MRSIVGTRAMSIARGGFRVVRYLSLGLAMALPTASMADVCAGRVIQIVVPFPAGTASDITTRQIANEMSNQMGRKIIILNKPGAGGLLATEYAAHASPDGCVAFAGSLGTQVFNPALYARVLLAVTPRA